MFRPGTRARTSSGPITSIPMPMRCPVSARKWKARSVASVRASMSCPRCESMTLKSSSSVMASDIATASLQKAVEDIVM